MSQASAETCQHRPIIVSVVLGDDAGAGHNLPYTRAVGSAVKLLGWDHAALLSRKTKLTFTPLSWRCVIHVWDNNNEAGVCRRLMNFAYLVSSLRTGIRATCGGRKGGIVLLVDSFTVTKLLALVLAVWCEGIPCQLWTIHRYDYRSDIEIHAYRMINFLGRWALGRNKMVGLTDSSDLSLFLKEKLKVTFKVLPIPHTAHVSNEVASAAAAELILWLPGQALPSKGVERIQFLLKQSTARAGMTVIRVASGPALSSTQGGPRLERVPNGVTDPEYSILMQNCQVVLLPYDSDSYSRRTSGVFVEAVIAGRLPITTRGTWMAKQLAQADLEECILDWSSSDVIETIWNLTHNKDTRRKLSVLRTQYVSLHSHAGYAEMLQQLYRAATPPPIAAEGSPRQAALLPLWRVTRGSIIDGILNLMYNGMGLIDPIIPKRNTLLLAAYPDVECQIVALLKELKRRAYGFERIYLLISGDKQEARARLTGIFGDPCADITLIGKISIRGFWTYLQSRHVIFTHGLYETDLPRPAGRLIVNVWHGIPVKGIWHANLHRNSRDNCPQCTALVASSQFSSDLMRRLAGNRPKGMLSTGLPRNDLLLAPCDAAKRYRHSACAGYKTLIVCLPTFRSSNVRGALWDGDETENSLMLSEAEIISLEALLKAHNALLLVKPHPLSVHYGQETELSPNIQIFTERWLNVNGMSLYDLLGVADCLISDISSVYIDYLCTQKPFFCYFPDLDQYRQTRGFSLEPIEDWMPSRICRTSAELLQELGSYFLGHDANSELRRQLALQLNSQSEPSAAAHIFDYLKSIAIARTTP